MYIQQSRGNYITDLENYSLRDLQSLLYHPSPELTVDQYILYIRNIRFELTNKYNYTVEPNYLFALLLNFIPRSIREYILNKHIVNYSVACTVASIIDKYQV
jgi:hypothetical protein